MCRASKLLLLDLESSSYIVEGTEELKKCEANLSMLQLDIETCRTADHAATF